MSFVVSVVALDQGFYAGLPICDHARWKAVDQVDDIVGGSGYVDGRIGAAADA